MIKINDKNLQNDDIAMGVSSDTNKSEKFAVGQEIMVTPTGFKEYGVFCDCGDGYTGLVHISRITPKFVRNVSDYFTIGTPFLAKIIEVHHDTSKLSLSTKEFNLEPKNPETSK